MPPTFGEAKVVKGERKAKRIEDYFAFALPRFANSDRWFRTASYLRVKLKGSENQNIIASLFSILIFMRIHHRGYVLDIQILPIFIGIHNQTIHILLLWKDF